MMRTEQDYKAVGLRVRCRLGNVEKGLLELQMGCVRHDSLAFGAHTVPDWQGCHCSSGRLQGSLGHT